jgi:hypothetical protein
VWDYVALAEQARHDIVEIEPLLKGVLEQPALARVLDYLSDQSFHLDDELWARIVYAFFTAAHRGSTGSEHLAAMFVPLYLWRASAFMAHTAREDAATLQERLDAVCEAFQQLKPVLVSSWSPEQ